MTEALISHTNGGAVRRLWACRRFTICASHKRTSNIEIDFYFYTLHNITHTPFTDCRLLSQVCLGARVWVPSKR